MRTLAAAQRAPQRVAALLASLPHGHERGLGNWQAELAEWPGLVMSTHGAARAMAQALSGLEVNVPRMRANLDSVRASMPLEVAAQWFDLGQADHSACLARAHVSLQTAAIAGLRRRSSADAATAPT